MSHITVMISLTTNVQWMGQDEWSEPDPHYDSTVHWETRRSDSINHGEDSIMIFPECPEL